MFQLMALKEFPGYSTGAAEPETSELLIVESRATNMARVYRKMYQRRKTCQKREF